MNEPAVRDIRRYLGLARSPLPEMRWREGVPIVQPHFADPFECKRILWVELHHVEVAHLCFVVVAGFEVIIGLGEKACLLGFLGAAATSVAARVSVTILNKVFDVCMWRIVLDLSCCF